MGQKLDDFELLRVLGAGSFARVYLARQMSLGRQVALKVSVNRGNEARTLAGLEHDHIVRVFSEVVDSAARPAAAVHAVRPGHHAGKHHRIDRPAARGPARAARPSSPSSMNRSSDAAALDLAALRDRELLAELDFIEAGCWMGARLAEALAHAHRLGVLHRDVKPANILVNRYGRPLLVDFNVASTTAGDEGVRGPARRDAGVHGPRAPRRLPQRRGARRGGRPQRRLLAGHGAVRAVRRPPAVRPAGRGRPRHGDRANRWPTSAAPGRRRCPPSPPPRRPSSG